MNEENNVRAFVDGQFIGEMRSIKVSAMGDGRQAWDTMLAAYELEQRAKESSCPLCAAEVPLSKPKTIKINKAELVGIDFSQLELRQLARPLDIVITNL